MRKRPTLKLSLALLPALLLPLLLAGCASSSHPDRGRSGIVAATCADKAQCEHYWHRTQEWVARNSQRPVRSVTDWMILTEEAGMFEVTPTYLITRWPGPRDSGEIRFDISCSDFLPCIPTRGQMVQDFSRYLTTP